jgi:hypothetical protein
MNPVHALPPCWFNICFNIIFLVFYEIRQVNTPGGRSFLSVCFLLKTTLFWRNVVFGSVLNMLGEFYFDLNPSTVIPRPTLY